VMQSLHHLGDPLAAVHEMARVATNAISINEPARAVVTNLAMKAGVAHERDDAGNWVARLNPRELEQELAAQGFHMVEAHRYAMYYRQQPGAMLRFLSRRSVLPFAIRAWKRGNRLLGGIGNKLTVQGRRNVHGLD
jgi:hypothetical protein